MISPVGTADRGLARPSLRDLGLLDRSPSVETLGYSHPSLRDEEGEILVALGFQTRSSGRGMRSLKCPDASCIPKLLVRSAVSRSAATQRRTMVRTCQRPRPAPAAAGF